eukprot:COSAG02_NODE_7640_length_2920_cov_5.152074_2_plen_170_part_00
MHVPFLFRLAAWAHCRALLSRYIANMCWETTYRNQDPEWVCNSSRSILNVSKAKMVALDAMTMKRAIGAKESLACNFTCNRTDRAYKCGLWPDRYHHKPEPEPPDLNTTSLLMYCLVGAAAVASGFMCVLVDRMRSPPTAKNVHAINEPLNDAGGDDGAPAAATATRVV